MPVASSSFFFSFFFAHSVPGSRRTDEPGAPERQSLLESYHTHVLKLLQMSTLPSIILVCSTQRGVAEVPPALDAWEAALRSGGLLLSQAQAAAAGASGAAASSLPLQLVVSAAGYKAAEFWALARGLPVRALVNSGRCGGGDGDVSDTACVRAARIAAHVYAQA